MPPDALKRHGPDALERTEAANRGHQSPDCSTLMEPPFRGCAGADTPRGRFLAWEASPGQWHALRLANPPASAVTCTSTPVAVERLWGALSAIGLPDPWRANWKPARRARAQRLRDEAMQARAA